MTSKEIQKKAVMANAIPPTLTSLYSDPDIVKAYPYTPALKTAIETAVPRPRVVRYGDVTLSIQDAVYPAIQGQTQPDAALSDLQAKLETLTT